MHELQQERTQIFSDVYVGKVPKRVPISVDINSSYAIQYAGFDLRKAQYDWDMIEKTYDIISSALVDVDELPMNMARFPAIYQMLESKVYTMASDGFIQHPEVSSMTYDEYDEFIEDPYKFLIEKSMPRLNEALNRGPYESAKNLSMTYYAYNDYFYRDDQLQRKMIDKYNYAIRPAYLGNVTPVDFIALALRGFSQISLDFRRLPDKITQAAQSLLPMQKMMGTIFPGHTDIYLHMPPFMAEKTFEKCYWPTFKEMVEYYVEKEQTVRLWCERDWMRYLDYLAELPDNICMCFEIGDPKLVKEKLGTKKIVSGLYPSQMFKTASMQECVDKAKEIMDIMAPGGAYIFNFDRGLLSINDGKIENVQAVVKTVKEYGIY